MFESTQTNAINNEDNLKTRIPKMDLNLKNVSP